MRKKSAQSLPDVPSLQRWSPQQFRNALTKCLFDNENSFYSYINRLSGEVSQINLLQKQELTPAEQEIIKENIGVVNPVLDYDLAINRPTIQGNELSGNMIDLYAQFRVDAAMPHVGEEEPNINLTKVWFDTNDVDNEIEDEIVDNATTFNLRREPTKTEEELSVSVTDKNETMDTESINVFEGENVTSTIVNDLEFIDNGVILVEEGKEYRPDSYIVLDSE